ncbi:MerR family DNA-binding transcriptional regulator [Moorena sp. SIO3I8]|uniref:MerR family DNA-binding transcriptional regulator n=1 Tax=Moorena sp. SIO3I8 TaxID=2607833 RepID=UPI0013C06025|nr:MerR family DNA-binding transcriptional regulator [Moorena sp. SIO3I8]NEO08442.1 MerR family DNA-binding transcriptional regulator [Moorena sp. SIO3I8]
MRLRTPKLACKELKISLKTLEYLHEQGIIEAVVTSNGVRRFDLDSIASKKNKSRLANLPPALDPYRPHWVTPKQAREILGVSNPTLISWEKQGKILCRRMPNNYRVYDVNSLRFDEETL